MYESGFAIGQVIGYVIVIVAIVWFIRHYRTGRNRDN